MDVDVPSDEASSEAQILKELSELIVQVDSRPLDVHLLKRQVQILASLPMKEEFIEATNTLSSVVALDPGKLSRSASYL